jgi:hypothetical protein
MRLIEIIQNLASFDVENTIYAVEPWTKDSESLVLAERPGGGVPPEAAELGMKYLVELAIAREILKDWSNSRSIAPTAFESCQRIIKYAKDDA